MLEGETRCGKISTLSFEEGRSATEILIAIRMMAVAAQELGGDVGFSACSMDVKQAFDIVSPESLSFGRERNGHSSNAGRSNFEGTGGGI